MIKEIPGYSKQYATDDGRIFSCRNGVMQEKPQRKDTKGYLRVNLRTDDYPAKTKAVNVHTLVLLTFVGERPEGCECRHLNGNCLDNRLDNLSWGTHAENMNDQIKHGTAICLRHGEESIRAKLKEKDVLEIRRLVQTGVKRATVARMYNLSWRHVSDICLRRTWKHLA